MYIKKLEIKGYKNAKENSEVILNKGLNILVGENGTGKTTIINALRLILKEDDYNNKITEEDFYKSFDDSNEISNSINIKLLFDGLTENEKIFYLSWGDADSNIILNMDISNKINNRGYYKKEIWSGVSKSSVYESELLDNMDCIYLPPLRDAETKLVEGRNSRLARLLKKLYKEEIEQNKKDNKQMAIVEATEQFNQKLIEEPEYKISKANDEISKKMKEIIGDTFAQSTNIQFSEIDFDKIIRSLRLMFFPTIRQTEIKKFRNISENSLGYNNLLYMATILAEIELSDEDYKLILIEEPEAHLHPQLQTQFIKYIEKIVKDKPNLQVIITTHSTVLASSVSIENIIHITKNDNRIEAINIANIGLEPEKIKFINRWLDATKSNLLFAKGVIFVEGISEGILIPELAKICLAEYNKNHSDKLPVTLEDAGVSVINMNGIYFKYFMSLYCNMKELKNNTIDNTIRMKNRCAGITDKDPDKSIYPTSNEDIVGKNVALDLIPIVKKSNNTRLYASKLKTFEYDLCMQGNSKIMAETLKELWPKENDSEQGVKNKLQKIINKDDIYENDELLSDDSVNILNTIESAEIGKGLFAQALADKLKEKSSFKVPDYIKAAIIWACGGNEDADERKC